MEKPLIASVAMVICLIVKVTIKVVVILKNSWINPFCLCSIAVNVNFEVILKAVLFLLNIQFLIEVTL